MGECFQIVLTLCPPVLYKHKNANGRLLVTVGVTSFCGANEGTRTPDLLITNQLLCQLSYVGLYGRDDRI